jgi:hypothetical protein
MYFSRRVEKQHLGPNSAQMTGGFCSHEGRGLAPCQVLSQLMCSVTWNVW